MKAYAEETVEQYILRKKPELKGKLESMGVSKLFALYCELRDAE